MSTAPDSKRLTPSPVILIVDGRGPTRRGRHTCLTTATIGFGTYL